MVSRSWNGSVDPEDSKMLEDRDLESRAEANGGFRCRSNRHLLIFPKVSSGYLGR